MASPTEVRVVYGAALTQGVALVAFPASSAILTSSQYYDLSNTAYGALFLPQAAAAILAAVSGANLIQRFGVRRLFLAGLVGDVAAMSLLVMSQSFIGQGAVPYVMLLLATTSLGIGFGLTVPALNTLAASFAPDGAGRAVLFLNALLGLGTALAPVLVAIFLGLGFWWGLPLVVAVLIVILIVVSLPLSLEVGRLSSGGGSRPGLPSRFRVFATFALLYGVVETVNGNWATLYMSTDLAAPATLASVALTTFWAMVTVGRILFAAIERRFAETRTFRLLPFVAAGALVAISALPSGDARAGVLAFGLAGFGCSALLPLTISFGQAKMLAIEASVAGWLIAFYQVGYGLAAFGVGPLQEGLGISLSTLYLGAAIVALAMGALSFAVVRPTQPMTA